MSDTNRGAYRGVEKNPRPMYARHDTFFGVSADVVERVFTAMFIFPFADGLALRTWCNAADLQRLL